MKLFPFLSRSLAAVRGLFLPEASLAALEMVRLLQTSPGEFEVAEDPVDSGVVFIRLRGDSILITPLQGAAIRLSRNNLWLDREGQLETELNPADRLLLLEATRTWLVTYN